MATINSINTYIVPTANREVTMPSQPAFNVYQKDAPISDRTGDGTIYSIIYDTELFDQNNDFTQATGIFTAPITGQYLFIGTVQVRSLGPLFTKGQLYFYSSNRTYYKFLSNYGYMRAGASSTFCTVSANALVDMDAGDTVTFRISVSNGGKVIDIGNGTVSLEDSYFHGFLVC